MADMQAISTAVKDGRKKIVEKLVTEALEEGVSAETILNKGLVVGMTELGELFKTAKYTCPRCLWLPEP